MREHFLDYSIDKYGQELVDDTKCLLNILVLLLPLSVYWSLADQQGSRWMFQSNKMNLDLGFYQMPVELIQFLNPFLVLVFIPLFEFVIYPLLNKIGFERPIEKLAAGGFLAAISFVMAAFVEWKIENSPRKSISIFWQIPQYVIISAGEVFFSITGLSYSYEQSPISMKSVVQSFWLLTVAFGDAIIILVGIINLESRIYEFLFYAGIMILDMFLFMYIAYKYKPRIVSEWL